MYKITTYKANGEITIYETQRPPTLKEVQDLVGGFITSVPKPYYLESNKDFFVRQHNVEKVTEVWCHEEALLKAKPITNKFFEPAPWGSSLYGNVTVVEEL